MYVYVYIFIYVYYIYLNILTAEKYYTSQNIKTHKQTYKNCRRYQQNRLLPLLEARLRVCDMR